jgi:hypothetical protein
MAAVSADSIVNWGLTLPAPTYAGGLFHPVATGALDQRDGTQGRLNNRRCSSASAVQRPHDDVPGAFLPAISVVIAYVIAHSVTHAEPRLRNDVVVRPAPFWVSVLARPLPGSRCSAARVPTNALLGLGVIDDR